jgi:hypothetical protein
MQIRILTWLSMHTSRSFEVGIRLPAGPFASVCCRRFGLGWLSPRRALAPVCARVRVRVSVRARARAFVCHCACVSVCVRVSACCPHIPAPSQLLCQHAQLMPL